MKVSNTWKSNEDLKTIKLSKEALTPADKLLNMYKLTKDEYNRLLDNAVTAVYKKSNEMNQGYYK